MATSLIKGSPLKSMLQFALPLLVGNLLQQTYNIIDAAIVGQILGAQALASVGASTSVQFLVLGFCMGSCTGFGIPVAKYFRRRRPQTHERFHLQRSDPHRSDRSHRDHALRRSVSVDPSHAFRPERYPTQMRISI